MSCNLIKFLSLFLSIFLYIGCASYDTNYSKDSENWNDNQLGNDLEIEHSFYLIGDAGNAELNEDLTLRIVVSKGPRILGRQPRYSSQNSRLYSVKKVMGRSNTAERPHRPHAKSPTAPARNQNQGSPYRQRGLHLGHFYRLKVQMQRPSRRLIADCMCIGHHPKLWLSSPGAFQLGQKWKS